MAEFVIKRLEAAHLSDVAAIERDTFSAPWSERMLEEICLSDHGVGFVALDEGGSVAAYVTAMVVPYEIQIANVATKADSRSLGLATRVLLALIEFAKELGAEQISLEVRVSNTAAIGLYKKLGFFEAGIRKNFYACPREDGIVMLLSPAE